MKTIVKTLILIVIILCTMEGKTQPKLGYIYMDSDSTAPYLMFRSNNIKELSDTNYTHYSVSSIFKRYEVESKIQVQSECIATEKRITDTLIGVYEIAVAKNNNDYYKTQMIDSIYMEWKRKPETIINCFTMCLMNNYFLYSRGEYLFYQKPKKQWKGEYLSLVFSDAYLRVTFKGFKQGNAFGGLSAFMSQLCYFNFGENIIEPGAKPTIVPIDFFYLYESGRFNSLKEK